MAGKVNSFSVHFDKARYAKNYARALHSAGIKTRTLGKTVRIYKKMIVGGIGSKATFRQPVRGVR